MRIFINGYSQTLWSWKKFNTISVMYSTHFFVPRRPHDHFIVIKLLSASFVLVLQKHPIRTLDLLDTVFWLAVCGIWVQKFNSKVVWLQEQKIKTIRSPDKWLIYVIT